MTGEIHTMAELRQRVREALREQNPEWIESDGRSPICDSYDARFARLLAMFETGHAASPPRHCLIT